MTKGFKDKMQQSSMQDKAMPKDEVWIKLQKKLKSHAKRKTKFPIGFMIMTIVFVILVLLIAFLMLYYIKIKTGIEVQ